ncbi:MAG: hypothetical protein ABFE08_11095 [Armatimonadia bacterium]
MRRLLVIISIALALPAVGEQLVIDSFDGGKLEKWSTSMSPDYYKGNTGQKGLQIVTDPERGQVLAADVRFVDPTKSEPCFISKDLTTPLPIPRLRTVSFWYKLTGDVALDAPGGFKLRLRNSPTDFTDYEIAAAPPVGKWVQCTIDTKPSSSVRNIWGRVFGEVTQLTFRLDDVDNRNAQFTLLVDDLVAEVDQTSQASYTPTTYNLKRDNKLDVLMIKHSAAGHYQLEEQIVRTGEGFKDGSDLTSYPFKGLHFGLDLYGFPKTIDPLLKTDLIVLVDVDPFILTPQQATWLADLVHSGAGMIFFGGMETLAKSRDFKRPLADLLPVTFTPGSAQFATSKLDAGTPHFLNAALADVGLGTACYLQKLAAKPDAMTILQGKDRPVVVASEFGKGRVAVVNAMPGMEQADDLFRNDLYPLLVRRLIQWTTRHEPEDYFTRLTLPPQTVAVPGEVVIEADTLRHNPQGSLLDMDNLSEGGQLHSGKLTYRLPKTAVAIHPYVIALRASKTESLDYHLFGEDPAAPRIVWPLPEPVVAPGDAIEFSVEVPEASRLPGMTLRARIPEAGQVSAPQPVAPTVAFKLTCPKLAPGIHPLEILLFQDGKQITAGDDTFWIAEPLQRKGFFPVITMAGSSAGGHYPDVFDGLELDDVNKHGFNTLAVGGLNQLARAGKPTASATLAAELLAQGQAVEGMATIFEYSGFNAVNSAGPTSPCVFSPEYPKAVADKLTPQLEVARRVPRLLSVKILDEPTVNPKMLDYCEYCQKVFQARYNIPLRKLEDIPATDSYARWAMADFMGYYVAEGYRQSYEFKQKSGAKFDLLLTYMSTGLGYDRPLSNHQDALDWSRWADRIDFDVYPYFYPVSQKIRMLQAAWCMAYIRQISQHLNKPWGFYVELDDRNWPFQQNPKEASAECAYEAVLQGADYLNSFIHTTFGTGTDSRPERWAWTGQELPKMRALGPILARTARPVAPVAFLYPNAQNCVTNEPVTRPYTYACVSQGFGNVDILPEEVALEKKAIPYKVLVMLGTDLVHGDLVKPLEQWVRDGGLLVLDKVPTRNHRGEEVRLPFEFPAPRESGEPEMLPYYQCALGKGRVVKLGYDPEALYKDAVEGDRLAEAAALRRKMAEALSLTGIRPTAVVVDRAAQMEVGVRQSKGEALVIVLNHDAAENEGTVTVRGLGFKPAWAYDAGNKRPFNVQATPDGCGFKVKLPARQGVMIYLSPSRPKVLPGS